MGNWILEQYNNQVNAKAKEEAELINSENIIRMETIEALDIDNGEALTQPHNQNALTTALKNARLL